MSAARKPSVHYQWRRNPRRLEEVHDAPKCFVCGELAEYTCDWIVCHYVDSVRLPEGDVHDCSQSHECDAEVCYLHVREVAEGRHYCPNHWDQTNPAQAAEVYAPTGSAEKAARAALNQQLRAGWR